VVDPIDRHLFFSSAYMQVRDGNSTPFWEARWLLGSAPKDLAPNLFQIARFKGRTVATKLHNNNWISNLGHISTSLQLEEFTLLFMTLAEVNLGDQKDSIFWKWTPDKKFSVATAYECKFYGPILSFPTPQVWKAFTDHKSKFFAWLIMHNRILTTYNMMKRNWPCEQLCSLCHCFMKTTKHLLCDCNFTEAVWNSVANAYNLPGYQVMKQEEGPVNWFKPLLSSTTTNEKRKRAGIILSVWWLLWKERNKRIF
jgi:hypothetical protein